MKRLTLMRHANAQWKDPQIADFNRPLNRRGQSEAESMSRRLLELRLPAPWLVSSTALRALQTAEIVGRELDVALRNFRSEEALYLASADDILRVVQASGPLIDHLMIVGHNPGITEVAQILAPDAHIEGMATAAVCSITFDVASWSDVGPGSLRDVMSETPPHRLFALWA